jgi:hypothetical protein
VSVSMLRYAGIGKLEAPLFQPYLRERHRTCFTPQHSINTHVRVQQHTHLQYRIAKGSRIVFRSDMPTNCPSAGLYALDPLFNVSDILQQRWDQSPKEDRKRLEKCWGYNDCGDCHRSDGFCGWCALVSFRLHLPVHVSLILQTVTNLSSSSYRFVLTRIPASLPHAPQVHLRHRSGTL